MTPTEVPISTDPYYVRTLKHGLHVAALFMKDDGMVERLLCEKEPYRYCLVQVYDILVERKELTRIEDIPAADKEDIFETAKNFCGEDHPAHYFRSVCRCIWCLQYLLKKYFIKP